MNKESIFLLGFLWGAVIICFFLQMSLVNKLFYLILGQIITIGTILIERRNEK
jgi:hypothetical protein